jgi:hypothetical protein
MKGLPVSMRKAQDARALSFSPAAMRSRTGFF